MPSQRELRIQRVIPEAGDDPGTKKPKIGERPKAGGKGLPKGLKDLRAGRGRRPLMGRFVDKSPPQQSLGCHHLLKKKDAAGKSREKILRQGVEGLGGEPGGRQEAFLVRCGQSPKDDNRGLPPHHSRTNDIISPPKNKGDPTSHFQKHLPSFHPFFLKKQDKNLA